MAVFSLVVAVAVVTVGATDRNLRAQFRNGQMAQDTEQQLVSIPKPAKALGCMKKLIEEGDTSCCKGPIAKLNEIREPDWSKTKNKPSRTDEEKMEIYPLFAFRQYTGTDYQTMNPLLRAYPNTPDVKVVGGQYYTKGGKMTDFTRGAIFVACAAKGLAEHGEAADSATVYRASAKKGVPEGVITSWTTVGGTFSDNAFFSTAKVKKYFTCKDPKFTPDIRFKLTTAANSRCKGIAQYSSHAEEEEVLCAPGTVWKVTHVKHENNPSKENEKDHCKMKVITVHAEEQSPSDGGSPEDGPVQSEQNHQQEG